ncbi:MAG: DEAD/DEAH box helicase, partial [Acidimicrobiales bacterium]
QEVLSDMESPHPMDRLICGDVGFGKTEVAMRAAFSAVAEGKQVAVLVPTTLLAQQHHQTFEERFAGHPVRVAALSRFLTSAQQRQVIAETIAGEVDVLIGTHRLLSEDVRFKNLGLLIVDEEQRFGVTHKESIKKFKTDIDVLTLSATPIPRTLEMSLTGIRDLSLLHTPPAERQPILTHVGEYDERATAEAIRRELLREGQVFFVHNKVEDITEVAARLQEMVPEARIGVAHGQMDEGSLEQVVIDFWERSYDVLVCTTIIESGIDMPSVNTLVVDRADLMGLGQLHQLRGRVGRSEQRAYAYLFYPPTRALTEKAFERLRTIGEATQLGSGFRIAMRDLELRGAGNLLGGTQSGHIAAVGYDLYCEMVTEAVAELKGDPVDRTSEINIDLPIKAFLPNEYVEAEEQRLEAYRKLAAVSELVEVADIEAEWIDRYGPVPEVAQTLLHVALLRAECVSLGLEDVSVTNRNRVRVSPIELTQSEQIRYQRLLNDEKFNGGTYKEEVAELTIHVREVGPKLPGDVFNFLRELRPTK